MAEEKWDWKKFARGFLSKKWWAWVVATILVFMKVIEGEWWFYITLAFLGINITQDWIEKLKDKNKNE
jgi:hypothetical protein